MDSIEVLTYVDGECPPLEILGRFVAANSNLRKAEMMTDSTCTCLPPVSALQQMMQEQLRIQYGANAPQQLLFSGSEFKQEEELGLNWPRIVSAYVKSPSLKTLECSCKYESGRRFAEIDAACIPARNPFQPGPHDRLSLTVCGVQYL